jgi:hypothetical protein
MVVKKFENQKKGLGILLGLAYFVILLSGPLARPTQLPIPFFWFRKTNQVKSILVNLDSILLNRTVPNLGESGMISAARDGLLYCTYERKKSRTLELLAFDEQSTFDIFPLF